MIDEARDRAGTRCIRSIVELRSPRSRLSRERKACQTTLSYGHFTNGRAYLSDLQSDEWKLRSLLPFALTEETVRS